MDENRLAHATTILLLAIQTSLKGGRFLANSPKAGFSASAGIHAASGSK
jgi:hypothetical protein